MSNKEKASDVEVAKALATHKKKFPTPQTVVTIYSQTVVTVDRSDTDDDRVESAWNAALVETKFDEAKKKKKIRVKVGSLLIKMVNRLIREEIIPAEAVSVVADKSFISIRILVAPSALPVIMLRCEHIGVGNVTGTVYACPLETSLVPPATKKKIDLFVLPETANTVVPCLPDNAGSKAAKTIESDEKTGTAVDAAGEEEDDDVESVSDSDDNEDDDGYTVPSSVAIPFLSLEQKKRLEERIIQARIEWRNTSSRVRVMQVIEEVTAGATFTFDYALFTFCAAVIAAVGLATDSSPTVIASMLVSPIMGPVMGMTFGTTVRSKGLVVMSLGNECWSLILCLLVGALLCIIAVASGSPQTRDWPSNEMLSRGDIYGLTSGIFVAIPSGMAVALSTLGKNSSGMVGVAISLSLLPPAVNASMCWTYELLLMSKTFNRNEGDTTDYWMTGAISFALTIINIICIWLAGTGTFWLKEVAPLKEKNAFWKNDISYYRNNKEEGTDLNVINDGIEAALELRDDVAQEDDLYKGAPGFDLTDRQAADARCHGLANNAIEDAFYLDNKALNTENIVPGGAIVLDEVELQDAANDTAMKEDLLNNANKFGCLQNAGKALFDNEMLDHISMTGDDVFVQTDVGIRHGAVAEDVLLHGLS